MTLGPALGIASSEISGKVTLMRERFGQLSEKIAAKEVGPIGGGGRLRRSTTLSFTWVSGLPVLACVHCSWVRERGCEKWVRVEFACAGLLVVVLLCVAWAEVCVWGGGVRLATCARRYSLPR